MSGTVPSVSGLLANLDSTNAAIRRFSAGNSSIFLSMRPDEIIKPPIDQNFAEEVNSVIEEDDDASETSSIILNSVEESDKEVLF